MSLRPYIPFKVDKLPEIFEFNFGNISYMIAINYNSVADMYTIDLYDFKMNPIVLGEKLCLNTPLWSECTNFKLPAIELIPMDESHSETVLNSNSFGKTVFLYINSINNSEESSEEYSG